MSAPIVVVGSLNMDFVVQVAQLPAPGETVLGSSFQTIPGGKGANQACAAGRLGGRVRMVGRVGEDVFGEQLRASLRGAGVDTAHVASTPATPSGVALIFVQAGGQNQIVVASGSNGRLAPGDVERALDGVDGGFLLLQLESALETVDAAAALGRRRGMRVVLDPAPAQPLPAALLASVDCLTPNETEAQVLLGRTPAPVTLQDAPAIASELLRRGPGSVVLKLGEKGAFYSGPDGSGPHPGFRVAAVDATAAGDTFNGAFAVARSEGRSTGDAIRFANAAAALSVTRLGAQASIPSRAEVEAFLAR
jgi:ribokinase